MYNKAIIKPLCSEWKRLPRLRGERHNFQLSIADVSG